MAEFDDIIDATFEHAVNIESLSITQARKLIVDLTKLSSDLNAQLRVIGPTQPTRFRTKKRRLDSYLKKAEKMIDVVYGKLSDKQAVYLKDLASLEQSETVGIVNESLGVDILDISIGKDELNLISRETLIDGLPPKEWFKNQLPAGLKSQLVRQLQTGIAQNETIQELVSRINKRVDISRNDVRTLVRTTTNGVSNKVRDTVYSNNSDVIDGEEHLSTLDLRTSDICIARDGLQWTTPDHKPIGGHGKRWKPFPLHFNERSTWIPVFKDISKMSGINQSKLDGFNQASIDGTLSDRIDYPQWFKKQSESRQLEIIGPGKLRLYKDGKLSLRDLVKTNGKSLTIQQLIDLKSA